MTQEKEANKERLRLRCFSAILDASLVAGWFADEAYEVFFRNVTVIPTREECANFPAWSQNLTMIVEIESKPGEWFPCGMVVGYHVNLRSRTVKAGILIDKKLHRLGFGHNAQTLWIDYLFKRLGFRKVVVENIHEHFTKPYQDVGFTIEGRFIKEHIVGGEYVDEIRMYCFLEDWKGTVK